MEFKDYYQTLGVARDATADDIKKAFRKLARKYHPDVSKEADAEERMKEVNEAYAVLSDPEKRAAYDQLGRGYQPGQDFRPPPDWDAGFEFSGRGLSGRAKRPISATSSPNCSAAWAARARRRSRAACARAGRGPPRQDPARPRGRLHRRHAPDHACACRSSTRRAASRLETRTLNVKIPEGVREGQMIRLAGQGAPGCGGAPAGDLLLEVHFKPHPRLRADGRDLHLTLPVAPWEAALGAVVHVDLPQGALKVRIPEGAQSGRQLRVRGKGIPGRAARRPAARLQVVLPPADTPQARELYETMAHELAFDPRAGGAQP